MSLVITDEMRAFVEPDIAKVKNERARVHALIRKLAVEGYYSDTYVDGLTQSAAATFTSKKGNCLSYTHMFIALARAAGLDARYELVNAPPTYIANEGVLVHLVHIRLRVLLPSRLYRERYVSIDFNRHSVKEFQGRVVSDQFARSLHYANDAVEYWRSGDNNLAFAYIGHAIKLAPKHPDHWVNLATFYKRLGLSEEALQINRYALSLDKSHVVALAGILEHAQGAEFVRLKTKVERRRAKNPYYQFALAQRAFEYSQMAEALFFIDRSLALERRNHRFFELKGSILKSLNNYEEAYSSYENALNFAKTPAEKQRYQRELDVLDQLLTGKA